MRKFTGLDGIDAFLADATERTSNEGRLTREIFHSCDRYVFDFHLKEGWEQLDTASDAHYFGVWVNKTERLALCYAEGDLSLTRCLTDEAYDDEVESLCKFHEPYPAIVTYDEKGRTEYYQDRSEFFIDPARGAAFKFKGDDEGSN